MAGRCKVGAMRACLVLIAALTACSASPVPSLSADMPADVADLVGETMVRIEAALPEHRRCLADLTVASAWELDNRAEYRIDDRTVVLRIPATAVNLEFSLAHEIAHHLETTCPAHADVQAPFLVAQGLDPAVPWFDGPSWEETPSEQFATAFAQMVTGIGDPERNVVVTEAALAVVAAWASGD